MENSVQKVFWRLVTAIGCVLLWNCVAGDFVPGSMPNRLQRVFHRGPGIWGFSLGYGSPHLRPQSELQQWDSGRVSSGTPPRQRLEHTKFVEAQEVMTGMKQGDLQTAGDSPYHVAVNYQDDSGPPYNHHIYSGWSHGPTQKTVEPSYHHSHTAFPSGWSHGPSKETAEPSYQHSHTDFHSGWSHGPSEETVEPSYHHSHTDAHSGWSNGPKEETVEHMDYYPMGLNASTEKPQENPIPQLPTSGTPTPEQAISAMPTQEMTTQGIPTLEQTTTGILTPEQMTSEIPPETLDVVTTPRPTPQCIRDLTQPSDLDPSWRLMLIEGNKRTTVDPTIVLSPPLPPIPQPPQQLSSDSIDKYETVYLERLSFDFDETARNAGYSIVKDRETSLNMPLPTPNTSGHSITSVVTIRQLPRVSAPLQGINSSKFKAGIDAARIQRERGLTRSPVENLVLTDLKTMWEVFREISDYEDKTEVEKDGGSPQVFQMPMMASRSEKAYIPEPDHSDSSILDAAFNFGLPASHRQFQSHSKIVEDWKRMKSIPAAKFLTSPDDLGRVYSGMAEFYSSLEEFVRSRTAFQRGFGADSFRRVEDLLQNSFTANQYLICLSSEDSNCTSPCVLDTALFRPQLGGFSGGVARVMSMPN